MGSWPRAPLSGLPLYWYWETNRRNPGGKRANEITICNIVSFFILSYCSPVVQSSTLVGEIPCGEAPCRRVVHNPRVVAGPLEPSKKLTWVRKVCVMHSCAWDYWCSRRHDCCQRHCVEFQGESHKGSDETAGCLTRVFITVLSGIYSWKSHLNCWKHCSEISLWT